MSERKRHIDTKLIHEGEPSPRIEGAVSMPIFQSSTFESEGGASYDTIKYIRLNNTPNHEALHRKLSALENAEAALVTASGMAAISTALLTVLKPGGHLLSQDVLYGGTLGLLDSLGDQVGDLVRDVGLVRVDQPAARLDVVHDCRQRLVEFVRDRRGQLAHGA